MKKAAIRPRLALVFLVALVLLAAGCGSGNEAGNAGSTATMTPESTATLFPTWTPAPPLPDSSVVTLVPAGPPAADGYLPDGLYLADASSGDTFKVETAPGPILEPDAWVSPTQLLVEGDSYYLLDLSAKTLRRLPASTNYESVVTFSHSSGLMTRLTDAGDLVISSVADNREVARFATGPIRYVLWAPDDKHLYWPGVMSGIASVGPEPHVVAIDTGGATSNVSWFADGSALALANADGIFSFNADTGVKTLLYSWPTGSNVVPDTLSLSADGRYAFVGVYTYRHAFVVPLHGGTQGIHMTIVDSSDADWSPTEDVVAVIADRCEPESRLLLVNADGTLRATIGGADFIPRFSADGTMIAYVGYGPPETGMQGKWGITVRSAEGDNTLISVAQGATDDEWWSPDGRWFAYSPTMLTSYVDSCARGPEKTEILPFP